MHSQPFKKRDCAMQLDFQFRFGGSGSSGVTNGVKLGIIGAHVWPIRWNWAILGRNAHGGQ